MGLCNDLVLLAIYGVAWHWHWTDQPRYAGVSMHYWLMLAYAMCRQRHILRRTASNVLLQHKIVKMLGGVGAQKSSSLNSLHLLLCPTTYFRILLPR